MSGGLEEGSGLPGDRVGFRAQEARLVGRRWTDLEVAAKMEIVDVRLGHLEEQLKENNVEVRADIARLDERINDLAVSIDRQVQQAEKNLRAMVEQRAREESAKTDVKIAIVRTDIKELAEQSKARSAAVNSIAEDVATFKKAALAAGVGLVGAAFTLTGFIISFVWKNHTALDKFLTAVAKLAGE